MSGDRAVKKRKFSAAILAGKTKRQAAIAAGYRPAGACVRGSELSRDPQVRADLARALNRAGATLDKCASRVNAAMDAVGPAGEVNLEAHRVRLDAVRDSLRARGLYDRETKAEGTTYMSMSQIINIVRSSAEERGVI